MRSERGSRNSAIGNCTFRVSRNSLIPEGNVSFNIISKFLIFILFCFVYNFLFETLMANRLVMSKDRNKFIFIEGMPKYLPACFQIY